MNSAPRRSTRFQRSVVHVEVGHHSGTAFLIGISQSSGLFLTAFHVVRSAWPHNRRIIRLRRRNGCDFKAKIIDVNQARDLALLAADVPPNQYLRAAPVATVANVGRLVVLRMLDPEKGIVAPLPVQVPFVGETALAYKIGRTTRIIDRVWSQQGLTIPGGTSGAPVVSEEDDAVVAVACAGSDVLDQAFFVPLITATPPLPGEEGRIVRETIASASEATSRLGRRPNRRGVSLRCWLKSRESARSLAISGVYDRMRTIDRRSLLISINAFLASDKLVAVLAGESGVGKSTSLAYLARRGQLRRPALLLRATQLAITQHTLEDALAEAFGLPSRGDLEHIAAPGPTTPLIVIDGINELTIRRDEWPRFIADQLSTIISFVARKRWKLLLTTRRERLEDLKQLVGIVEVYDPAPEVQRSDLPQLDKVDPLPAIRLGSYDRGEFDRLVKLYELPSGLPFADLRHPIVFRLMVAASKHPANKPIRVRDLFAQYFTDVIDRIHGLCQSRNRDRIIKLIEGWTAHRQTAERGYISAEVLGESINEAVAEAAVTEGLLERIPGGYRYIYDEVSDYVCARDLVERFDEAFRTTGGSLIQIVKIAVASRISSGAIARALELFGDNNPASLKKVAAATVADLVSHASSARFDLMQMTDVLCRVEKGTPLDQVKEQLPIFRMPGEADGSEWNSASVFPIAVSDDHISYAFDESQMWRMVRFPVAADFQRQSYPYRSKDINDERSHAHARYDLENSEIFKVLRHFMTGFPVRALARLSNGLVEDAPIGPEHSFGSFCAQVIAVYAERFPLIELLQIISRDHRYSVELFHFLARCHFDQIADAFLDDDIGLTKNPSKAATLLGVLLAIHPDQRGRVAKHATTLVFHRGHPVNLYSAFFTDFANGPYRDQMVASIQELWTAGFATGPELMVCVTTGLLTFDQVIELFARRLKEGTRYSFLDGFRNLILDLCGFLRTLQDPDKRTAGIDKVIAHLWAFSGDDGREQAKAAESLLETALDSRAVSAPLRGIISDLWMRHPGAAAEFVAYPLASDKFDELAPSIREDLCNLMIENSPESVAIELVATCITRSPGHATTAYLSRRHFDRFGAESLFDYAKQKIAEHQQLAFPPTTPLVALLKFLRIFDPVTFSRYEKDLEYALAALD